MKFWKLSFTRRPATCSRGSAIFLRRKIYGFRGQVAERRELGRFFTIMAVVSCLTGCSQSPSTPAHTQKTVHVERQSLEKKLYFTGVIQPLEEKSLSAPFDATVTEMPYHFGQIVHQGDVIFTLDSSDLQKQFTDAVTDYLKAKDSYAISQAKFSGTDELWKAGLIAKNNYLSEKSSVDTARISLMESSRKLNEILSKLDDSKTISITNLSLANYEEIKRVLSVPHNLIHLRAPSDGILLYPPKSAEETNASLSVGSMVKTGQVMIILGDLKGVTIEINVPETDIADVHPGLKADITGVALGQQVLHGEVVAVNSQATSVSGSLPTFTALIQVKTLNPEQQQQIKVGMSAAIALSIHENPQLQIPIAAVHQDKSQAMVTILQPNGQTEERAITTGSAQVDQVIVLTGLHENDTVVYDG